MMKTDVLDNDNNTDAQYTTLFEAAYVYIDTRYHGVDMPEDNINDCLTAALELYDADHAYILELDEELDVVQSLYSKAREGYDPTGGISYAEAEDDAMNSNLFSGIIKRGEPYMFLTEQLRSSHPAEYQWLTSRGVFNAMGVPFKTHTELVAFFCVNNVGRFWEKMSFLSLSTKALANEIRAIRMMQLIHAAKRKSPELKDSDVLIKLFGGFEITTNIGSVDFADLSSDQCGRFLLYLLKNRSRTIPVREIAEILWPEQLIDNPYNMVKGVAFRVRKILDGICPQKLVVAKSGTYAINDTLTIIIDIETFDQICDRTHSIRMTDAEKQQAYEKALRVYKGDMLPNYESEIWLLGWIGYYQIKYLEIFKEYLQLLKATAQFGRIFEAVSGVMSIGYNDGDIFEILIDALIQLGKPELARSYYTRIDKLLPEERRRQLTQLLSP